MRHAYLILGTVGFARQLLANRPPSDLLEELGLQVKVRLMLFLQKACVIKQKTDSCIISILAGVWDPWGTQGRLVFLTACVFRLPHRLMQLRKR